MNTGSAPLDRASLLDSLRRAGGGGLLRLVPALAWLLAAPAFAGDGVVEINQSCATVTGCNPNDSPGFPVSFNFGGAGHSYVLTSDLEVPDAATSAISLPFGASLDMNGFTIAGPTSCSGKPATCSGAGSGTGINAGGGTIRNGTIRGMGGAGIQTNGGRIENLLIQGNGGTGVVASGNEILQIANSRILQNGGDGIYMAAGQPRGSLVVNNSIFANTEEGIEGQGVTVLGNMIDNNGSYGLKANVGTTQAAYGQNGFFNNNGSNANVQVIGGQSLGANYCGDAAC